MTPIVISMSNSFLVAEVHVVTHRDLRVRLSPIAVTGEPRLADHRGRAVAGGICEPSPVVDSISLVLR